LNDRDLEFKGQHYFLKDRDLEFKRVNYFLKTAALFKSQILFDFPLGGLVFSLSSNGPADLHQEAAQEQRR
jgi:hypothetical protein